MPSFREISLHFPALLIDTASSLVQVGLIEPDSSVRWESSGDESGVAVFQSIEKLGVDPQQMNAFVFCDGPGSVLGIRTAAMALRTWNVLQPRPLYAYSSLALVAHALAQKDLAVIADARRDSWHHFQIDRGLRRVTATELTGTLVMPDNFRNWAPLPPNVSRVPYLLAELLPRIWDVDLLRPTNAPDAFLHEEPNYVTWTPQVHRAPKAS
jgi:tRNA threonylcarbamoyladenosine biosynthesis protein TsaB